MRIAMVVTPLEDLNLRLASQIGVTDIVIRRIETTKALSCAWMAGKKEFSAVVVKAFKSFFQIFRCLTASPGRAVGSWSWNGTSRVRGLISERSYPWAVEPAGLNGSIRHRLSGEGSGGELERCLRWGRAGAIGSGTAARPTPVR